MGIRLLHYPLGQLKSRMPLFEKPPDPPNLPPIGLLPGDSLGQMRQPNKLLIGCIGQKGKGAGHELLKRVIFHPRVDTWLRHSLPLFRR
jgi:hypothetical protein